MGPAPRGYADSATAAAASSAATAAAAGPVAEPTTVLLSNGDRMPLIGLGTYKLSSPDSVKAALELGYRSIDCE